MSVRRYRVIKSFPWIEGGRPVPGEFKWEGGKDVVYQPGDIIDVDDRDLASLYRELEGLDDAGRAALEEIRAEAEGPAKRILTADIPLDVVEWLTRALDEKRRIYGCEMEQTWATYRDGSKKLLSTVYYPTKPLPGAVHGDDGLPDPWATADRKRRWEMESEIARIRSGASRGARRSRETRRDETARSNEALLAAVRAYRKKHPLHGRPTIAEALVDEFDGTLDHADPRGRQKAIEALRKRIERLEKSLDR